MEIKLTLKFVEPELDAIAVHEGRVVVIVSSDAKIDQLGRRVNKFPSQFNRHFPLLNDFDNTRSTVRIVK